MTYDDCWLCREKKKKKRQSHAIPSGFYVWHSPNVVSSQRTCLVLSLLAPLQFAPR